jgi:hypothetical protein
MWLKNITGRATIVSELFLFLWKERLWWMIPSILVLLLVGTLIFIAQGSAVTPFLYALF